MKKIIIIIVSLYLNNMCYAQLEPKENSNSIEFELNSLQIIARDLERYTIVYKQNKDLKLQVSTLKKEKSYNQVITDSLQENIIDYKKIITNCDSISKKEEAKNLEYTNISELKDNIIFANKKEIKKKNVTILGLVITNVVTIIVFILIVK